MRFSLVLLYTVAFLTAPLVAAAAEPSVAKPTFSAAQADFDNGQYPQCLSKISGLISTTKPDEPGRFDLLMLRGECFLRLKQRDAASAAVTSAAAVGKRQRDVQRTAAATALGALIKASPDLTYRSKGSAAGAAASGVDIVDPASRQKAMGTLLEDVRARVRPRYDKAMDDRALKSTDALLRDMWELYSIEQAATGDTADTSKKLEALGDHAHGLIAAEVTRLTKRFDQLDDLASDATGVGYGVGVVAARGLRTEERNELKELSTYLTEIQRTIENARRIARLLGRKGEKWDALLADCAVARDSAQMAYDRRY